MAVMHHLNNRRAGKVVANAALELSVLALKMDTDEYRPWKISLEPCHLPSIEVAEPREPRDSPPMQHVEAWPGNCCRKTFCFS